jgi:EmrB/QacA subfamily drug resistance transporter
MSGEIDAPAKAAGLTRWQLRTVLVALFSGQLLSALDQNIVGTALPTMVGQLGRLDDFSLVVTAYLLTSTITCALYGKLADIYGAKPVYLFAIAVFTAGATLVGFSHSIDQMVAFRAVQGVGAGGLVVIAFTIRSSVLPPRQIGRIQGLVGAMYTMTALAGPVIGGAFTEYLSWRWCFLIDVPIGVLSLIAVATLLRLPATPRGQHGIDYLGATLLTAGVSALVLAAVWGGGPYAWNSPVIVGLLTATALIVVAFVLRQRWAAEPLMPARILRLPGVRVAMVITFLVGTAVIGGYYFLPIYLQVVRSETPTAAGLQMLPLALAVMVGSGVSGWLVASLLGRMKAVVIIGTAIMTLSLYLLSRLGSSSAIWQLWIGEAVLGVGMGMVISKLIIAVQNSAPRSDLGAVTAQMAFFRTIGSTIGTAALGAVLISRLARLHIPGGRQVLYAAPKTISRLAGSGPRLHDQLVLTYSQSLRTVFLAAIPLMVVAFVLTWFLPNTKLRAEQKPWGDSDMNDTTSVKVPS